MFRSPRSPGFLPILLCSVLALHPSCRSAEGRPRASPLPPSGIEALPPTPPLPSPPRELRGLWVATFMGIDWPRCPSGDPTVLRAGIEEIADKAAAWGLNAIFLQVRPCGDAIYPSALAPWSSWLSGEQGKAPEGGFDPLSAWIEECSKRGLRLHAWINPFRVGAPSVRSYADHSIPKAQRELVMDLGAPGYLWLDPGKAASRSLVADAVREIVRNYPVDGIVLDDYFYPYKEQYPSLSEIPDAESYRAAVEASAARGETAPALDDWRRSNIDALVRELGSAIRELAPDLPFGVSPFGIWRPDPERGISGKDAWAELYEDSRAWLSEGWVDYLCPQLYWPISRQEQSFPILLERWNAWNARGRILAPALRLAQPGLTGDELSRELVGQVLIERAMRRAGGGTVLFSARSLDLAPSLAGVFSRPALPPPMPWLGGKPPPAPSASLSALGDGHLELSWQAADAREIIVRSRGPGRPWSMHVLPAAAGGLILPEGVVEVRLSAVDRAGREGVPAVLAPYPSPLP